MVTSNQQKYEYINWNLNYEKKKKRMKHMWFSINFSTNEIKGSFLEKTLNAKPPDLLLGLHSLGYSIWWPGN